MYNPNEEFVVIGIHRKSIADMFNEIIEDCGDSIDPFSGNDARLTNEVCREVADAFSEAYRDSDNDVDRDVYEREGVLRVFEKYFG